MCLERPIPLELSSTIFFARDCLPVLQYVASFLLLPELVHFLVQWKTTLVARMNFFAEASDSSDSMRRLMSREGNFGIFALQCHGETSDLYTKEKKIGEGAHKIVFLLKKWLLGGGGEYHVAMAQARGEPCEEEEQLLVEEGKISARLRRHGISGIMDIRVIRYYRNSSMAPYRRAIMEYCEGGSLPRYLSRIPAFEERLRMCRRVVETVQQMHLKRTVHLDLKPENFCVRQGDIRLGDLGSACYVPPGLSTYTALCSTFPPPEMILNEESGFQTFVNSQLDLWNVGNMIYFIMKEKNLFDSWNLYWSNQQYGACLARLRTAMLPLKNGALLDRMIYDLVSRDPAKRPSLSKVLQAIREMEELVRGRAQPAATLTKQ